MGFSKNKIQKPDLKNGPTDSFGVIHVSGNIEAENRASLYAVNWCAKTGWIRVDDKAPADGEYVLAIWSSQYDAQNGKQPVVLMRVGSLWVDCDGGSYFDPDYWMPLPMPPDSANIA